MAKEIAKENENKRFYEPECPVTRGVYEWQVDDKGHHLLVKVGEKNFDDEIQLYKDQCDIKILVDQMMKGNVEVISRLSQPGVYGDTTQFPEECHPDALDDTLKQFYENQPSSVKEKYPRYEDFKKYFLSLTNENIAAMAKQEAEAKAKTEQDQKDAEAAAAQAALDAQAAAIAKALKEVK